MLSYSRGPIGWSLLTLYLHPRLRAQNIYPPWFILMKGGEVIPEMEGRGGVLPKWHILCWKLAGTSPSQEIGPYIQKITDGHWKLKSVPGQQLHAGSQELQRSETPEEDIYITTMNTTSLSSSSHILLVLPSRMRGDEKKVKTAKGQFIMIWKWWASAARRTWRVRLVWA